MFLGVITHTKKGCRSIYSRFPYHTNSPTRLSALNPINNKKHLPVYNDVIYDGQHSRLLHHFHLKLIDYVRL